MNVGTTRNRLRFIPTRNGAMFGHVLGIAITFALLLPNSTAFMSVTSSIRGALLSSSKMKTCQKKNQRQS
jgi:hypothetical protein